MAAKEAGANLRDAKTCILFTLPIPVHGNLYIDDFSANKSNTLITYLPHNLA